MSRALYRKYRSKKLGEVIGQDHITTALKNALKSGKISHAYLFTGPKGVGKTSVARILAHEVNNFAYDEDKYYVDIIEIDAASNRRIDEIRDLRDKVHIAPTVGKYKVYIIDEVHMLTKEAFNALLKTLEEPPAHVIFILATTEAHKLPATIVSRTQRFTFKPIEEDQVVEHLKAIAKKEGLKVDEETLRLIAKHGEGSFRDSISLLDQAAALDKQVSLEEIQQLLGLAPDEAITKLLVILTTGTPRDLLNYLDDQYGHGINAASLARQLSTRLRDNLVNDNYTLPLSSTTSLLRKLIDVPASSDPTRLLELTLIDEVLTRSSQADKDLNLNQTKEVEEPTALEDEEMTNPPTELSAKLDRDSTQFNLEVWPKLLEALKNKHNTLYGIMRMAKPYYEDKVLTLEFEFAFHQKRLNEVRNHKIIEEVLRQHLATPIEIISTVSHTSNDNQIKEASQAVKTISNIFGGAEVLDS